jgi:hypothetical protein
LWQAETFHRAFRGTGDAVLPDWGGGTVDSPLRNLRQLDGVARQEPCFRGAKADIGKITADLTGLVDSGSFVRASPFVDGSGTRRFLESPLRR